MATDVATTDPYTTAVVRLEEIKQQKRCIEREEKELTASIKAGLDSGLLEEDTIKMLGLEPRTRSGGYDDSMVALCKKKELDDCWGVKEVLDQKQVKEAIEMGQLSEDEVAPYKKADTFFLQLPREKA